MHERHSDVPPDPPSFLYELTCQGTILSRSMFWATALIQHGGAKKAASLQVDLEAGEDLSHLINTSIFKNVRILYGKFSR